MSKEFFTPADEKIIVDAVKEAEKRTSGEIRVHVEEKCVDDTPIKRTQAVFAELNMHETELKNGILLYIATEDKKVAIWGDQGIHDKVGQQFWEDEIKLIIEHFKKGERAQGVAKAISNIGEKLRAHFPYQKDDVNELDDNISYGDQSKKEDN